MELLPPPLELLLPPPLELLPPPLELLLPALELLPPPLELQLLHLQALWRRLMPQHFPPLEPSVQSRVHPQLGPFRSPGQSTPQLRL